MNIFILDKDLFKSANLLCNQHLNKQILELCQILSTNGYGKYKATHKHHPVTKWANDNLRFCFRYLHILHKEYSKRTSKIHKSYLDTKEYEAFIPADYEDKLTDFPIKNDLELINRKYKEWSHRARPMYPRFTKYETI